MLNLVIRVISLTALPLYNKLQYSVLLFTAICKKSSLFSSWRHFILSWLNHLNIKCCRLYCTCRPLILRNTKSPKLQLQGFYQSTMTYTICSSAVESKTVKRHWLHFCGFFTKTCNKSLCWLCEHRGLPPNSFNNHMVDAVVLSEYLSGRGAWWRETEGVIKREWKGQSERKKEERGSLLLSVLGHRGLEEVLTQTHFSETDSSI